MSELSSTAAALVAKKLREEGDANIKLRLVDKSFHATRYVDPLAPREGSDRQFWPKEVTPEMEQRWLAIIRKSRSV
ncbi:hypothetical protein ACQKWADRAFT_288419 [Trichoderma austrokoningii]